MRRKDERKLKVKKQTLRTLVSEDMDSVRGGMLPVSGATFPRNNCTAKFSGCISQC
jgi:hypothetical protein